MYGIFIWVFPKIGKHPKMDGENNGKPYEQMDDLGGKPTIFGNIHIQGKYSIQYRRSPHGASRECGLIIADTILHVSDTSTVLL